MDSIPDRARELLRAVRPADDADESAGDRRDEPTDATGVSRRRFLGATTALGVGSVAPGAATAASRSQGRHHIVLNSPSSTPAEYQFAVTGDVQRTTDTGSASSASATIDTEDGVYYPSNFDGAMVRGATQGGLDAYVYTGQIVSFEAANCGSLNVWVNGSRQPACQLNRNYNMDVGGGNDGGDGGGSGDSGGGRYHLVLHNPSSVSRYEITVSRNAWQTADAGSVSARSASIDGDDRIDDPRGSEGRILRGSTSGEIDAYVYEGQIVEFDASNCGSLDVWVNGEYQPACALNREY